MKQNNWTTSCTQNEAEHAQETLIWLENVTEKETGNAQPGACVDVLPRCWVDQTPGKVWGLPRTQTSLFWWKFARKGRREGDSPAVCTLPMVPCGSSPVTRFALASAMRKTKRLRRRLAWGLTPVNVVFSITTHFYFLLTFQVDVAHNFRFDLFLFLEGRIRQIRRRYLEKVSLVLAAFVNPVHSLIRWRKNK